MPPASFHICNGYFHEWWSLGFAVVVVICGGCWRALPANNPHRFRFPRRFPMILNGCIGYGVRTAAQLDGEQGQPAHQGRPHHGWPRANQQGADSDAGQRGDRPAPAPQQPTEEGGEKRGEDGNIESTDIKPIWMFVLHWRLHCWFQVNHPGNRLNKVVIWYY